MIKHSIEIERPAEEVFAYLEQVDRSHTRSQSTTPRAKPRSAGPPARFVPSAHTPSIRRASRAHA
jgi:hypothetical protein